MSHFIYLVRHGEQENAEYGINDGHLSERGREQAHAIGRRLEAIPFDAAFTSPLDRAMETAVIIDQYTQGPAVQPNNLLFDCIPSSRESAPEAYASFFSGVDDDMVEAGQAQMQDAVGAFLTHTRGDRHTLLVTHNFVIGYLVAHALELPQWRWLTLGTAHSALTVLRLRSTRPNELSLFGDCSHVPLADRTGTSWTPLV